MTLSRKKTYSRFGRIEQASWKKLPLKFKPVGQIEGSQRKGEEGLKSSRKKKEHVTMTRQERKWHMAINELLVIRCASVSSK